MNDFLKLHTANAVAQIEGYTPGEQPSDGNWVKLNTNEFPYPPSPKVREAILDELGGDGAKLRLYPDPISKNLRSKIGKFFGLSAENVIAGNGSDDILNLAVRAFSDPDKPILSLDPSYSLYPVLAKIQNSEFIELPFGDSMDIPFEKIASSRANIFFFTNPNAPTGVGFSKSDVERILNEFGGLVLVDEAYAPFAEFSASELVDKYPNLIVAGTTSKGWGLAGMRIGWGLANPDIINILDRVRDSYNLDRLAQAAGMAAFSDNEYYGNLCGIIKDTRDKTELFFESVGWKYFKSSSNFILVTPKNKNGKSGRDVADEFFKYLKSIKILVRYFPNCPAVCDSVRISVGTPEQMILLQNAVKDWISL